MEERDIARFFKYVVKTKTCWNWVGNVTPLKYGRFNVRGFVFKSHRYSWMIVNGNIPVGGYILHSCDNPSCVNPKHLWVGTQTDNMRDMHAKGRSNHACGERAPRAKLTWKDIGEIRKRRSGGEIIERLAEEFKIDPSSMSRVVNMKSWVYGK